MRIGCGQACACISSCYEKTKQSFVATVLTLDEIRNNPETFQKTCIVVQSFIQGINFFRHTNYLSDLVSLLDTAHSFDFYGICRLPRHIFHFYNPDRVDEWAILDQLESILCANWKLGENDAKGRLSDPRVRQFAQKQIKSLLKQMDLNQDEARTEEEFKKLLKAWLIIAVKALRPDGFNPNTIELEELKIPLKKLHIFESLGDWIFIGVDIACFPAFLQYWNLIDLSSISNRMGRLSLIANLDDWIMGTMCVGYLINIFEAARRLHQENLNVEERRHEKWVISAAALDILYNLTMLKEADIRWVTFFAFAAKLTGIIQILLIPKPTFFTPAAA